MLNLHGHQLKISSYRFIYVNLQMILLCWKTSEVQSGLHTLTQFLDKMDYL